MPVYAPTEQQFRDTAHALFGSMALKQPPRGNLEAATTAHDTARVNVRGRWYTVAPLSYRHGLWLQTLEEELMRLGLYEPSRETRVQEEAVYEAMVDLFAQIIHRPWWTRWRRNPFVGLSVPEIRGLSSFFSHIPTTSPVVAQASTKAPEWVQQTWPTRSDCLRVGIHAGWPATAIPAVSGTIRSD